MQMDWQSLVNRIRDMNGEIDFSLLPAAPKIRDAEETNKAISKEEDVQKGEMHSNVNKVERRVSSTAELRRKKNEEKVEKKKLRRKRPSTPLIAEKIGASPREPESSSRQLMRKKEQNSGMPSKEEIKERAKRLQEMQPAFLKLSKPTEETKVHISTAVEKEDWLKNSLENLQLAPLKEKRGNQWFVANNSGSEEFMEQIAVQDTKMSESVSVLACSYCEVQVGPKISHLEVDECHNCFISCGKVITSVELYKNTHLSLFVKGRTPTIQVDDCHHVRIYLPHKETKLVYNSCEDLVVYIPNSPDDLSQSISEIDRNDLNVWKSFPLPSSESQQIAYISDDSSQILTVDAKRHTVAGFLDLSLGKHYASKTSSSFLKENHIRSSPMSLRPATQNSQKLAFFMRSEVENLEGKKFTTFEPILRKDEESEEPPGKYHYLKILVNPLTAEYCHLVVFVPSNVNATKKLIRYETGKSLEDPFPIIH